MRPFDQSQFLATFEHYPDEIKNLIDNILDKGFSLTLVGGGARNYLMNGSCVDDLDFEIRLEQNLDESTWKQVLRELRQELKQSYKLEELSYGVFRILITGYDIEFASPRLEVYPSKQESFGHSDFTAQLICNLDYAKAFARRDFTINAIGIEINKTENEERSAKLIDPFSGVKDLEQEKLDYCGEHFFKDPVRFLRAIRFKINMNLNYGERLIKRMQEFDLSKLSQFYVFKESSRTLNIKFFREFYNLCNQFKIVYPVRFKILLDFCSDNSSQDEMELEQMLWLAVEQGKMQRRELVSLASLLKIKQRRVDELLQLKNLLLEVKDSRLTRLKNIEEDFAKLPQDILLQFKQLIELISYFEKQELYPYSFGNLDKSFEHELQSISKGLKELKSDQDFIQKRSVLKPKDRAIYGIYFLFVVKK